ncbi:hypothetical protein SAMN05192588_0315 [Nonlabens sp. Hel1_33_55]|nr:hypothetical protein SAMN05192588_0315 [Nonlabens sp. Hel1_33_55]
MQPLRATVEKERLVEFNVNKIFLLNITVALYLQITSYLENKNHER